VPILPGKVPPEPREGKEETTETASIPPKKKDFWDKIVILTPLIGTALLSFLGTVLTQQTQYQTTKLSQEFQNKMTRLSQEFQDKESERNYQFEQYKFEWEREARKAQADLQYAQNRVEELKALTALAPMLASKDKLTRDAAETILLSLNLSKSKQKAEPLSRLSRPLVQPQSIPSNPRGQSNRQQTANNSQEGFLEIAIKKLLDKKAPVLDRENAALALGSLAKGSKLSASKRNRAEQAITRVVKDPQTPASLRQTASEILTQIRELSPNTAYSMARSGSLRKSFRGVMLHHSATSLSSFSGLKTVMSLARFQVEDMNHDNVSWHFAVAPNGKVWIGAPLDQKVVGSSGHNDYFVSILIFMNGDSELPTVDQQQTLANLLSILFKRMDISSVDDMGVNRGFHFHSDNNPTSCPGRMLTKQMIKGWISEVMSNRP
jgi:hypothetical protein